MRNPYIEFLFQELDAAEAEYETNRAFRQAQAEKELEELAELYRKTPNPFPKLTPAEVEAKREEKRAANRAAWRDPKLRRERWPGRR